MVICLPPFGDLSWLFVHVQSAHPESNRRLRLRTCALPLSYVPMIGSQRQLTARLKRGFPSKTFLNAAALRIRTRNLMPTKHLLCQLSYDGKFGSQRSETDCLYVGGYKVYLWLTCVGKSRRPVCLWLPLYSLSNFIRTLWDIFNFFKKSLNPLPDILVRILNPAPRECVVHILRDRNIR